MNLPPALIAPLNHLGLIQVTGTDAETFLQGQLSNDVRVLSANRAQLSSYNSPKGRMLAVLHLFRNADSIFLEMHRSVLEATLKRLRMFVLRSKVQLQDVSVEHPALGLSGNNAAALLQEIGLPGPADSLDAAWENNVCVIRRLGEIPRFTIHAPRLQSGEIQKTLQAKTQAADTNHWKLLDILAGVPTVYPETSDHFVPQMCNLDTLGGISFNKGCYTGQEIVARVHYRGAIKRTMSRIHLPQSPPAPGTKLEQGEVVDAVSQPEGGSSVLVVGSG